MIIPKKWQVTEIGAKGDTTFVWAKILTDKGPILVGSVYAPNQRKERMELWRWMTHLNPDEQWIIGGDWNMVDLWDDAIGPCTLIHRRESRTWTKFVDKFTLVDNYLCAGERKGPHFT